MSCTLASEQSRSPAVRVAAFYFWVAEWTFSSACVPSFCNNPVTMAKNLLNLDTTIFSIQRREGGLEVHFMDEVLNPDDKKTQPMSKRRLYFRLLQILDSWKKIRVIRKVRR